MTPLKFTIKDGVTYFHYNYSELDAVHYVRFRTENSEYEWWTGEYPKRR